MAFKLLFLYFFNNKEFRQDKGNEGNVGYILFLGVWGQTNTLFFYGSSVRLIFFFYAFQRVSL